MGWWQVAGYVLLVLVHYLAAIFFLPLRAFIYFFFTNSIEKWGDGAMVSLREGNIVSEEMNLSPRAIRERRKKRMEDREWRIRKQTEKRRRGQRVVSITGEPLARVMGLPKISPPRPLMQNEPDEPNGAA